MNQCLDTTDCLGRQNRSWNEPCKILWHVSDNWRFSERKSLGKYDISDTTRNAILIMLYNQVVTFQIYWFGPILGGITAGVFYQLLLQAANSEPAYTAIVSNGQALSCKGSLFNPTRTAAPLPGLAVWPCL